MQRTEEEWRSFARNLMNAVDSAPSISAVNAIETHNDPIFRDLKKASIKMHDYLIDYIDKRRVELAGSVK